MKTLVKSRLATWVFALVFGCVGLLAADPPTAFVEVTGTEITFHPLFIVSRILNAAVSGVEAAVPLLVLAAGVWVILRMFGIVGGVKKR